jgi:hypothetical protein
MPLPRLRESSVSGMYIFFFMADEYIISHDYLSSNSHLSVGMLHNNFNYD